MFSFSCWQAEDGIKYLSVSKHLVNTDDYLEVWKLEREAFTGWEFGRLSLESEEPYEVLL